MKILLIGIDGGSWDILNLGIKNDKLPTFRWLMNNGVSGILKSTIPPTTCPAIPSLVTGKNPGKMGIYSYFKEGAMLRVISAIDIKEEAIWDILSKNGIRCAIVGVPLTYPPKKINGVMISGPPLPFSCKYKKDYTHPKNLATIIDYPLESTERSNFIELIRQKGIEFFFKKYKNITTRRLNIFKNLIIKSNFDFSMFFIKGSDILQHFIWDKKELLIEYYQIIDDFLKDLLDLNNIYDILFVFSDHGFEGVKKYFYINSWLTKMGYKSSNIFYKINSIYNDIFENSKSLNIMMSKMENFWKKNNFIKSLYSRIRKINILNNSIKNIAYSKEIFGIRINNKFITKNIIYEKIRNNIIKNLSNLKINNENIINIIKKREDVYKGPYLNSLPDIVFLPYEGIIPRLKSNLKILIKPKYRERNGQHTSAINGIFIAHGTNINKNKKLINALIYDLYATILYIYDIPIPIDVDGKVLQDIFQKNSTLGKKAITYQKITEKDKIKKRIKYIKKQLYI